MDPDPEPDRTKEGLIAGAKGRSAALVARAGRRRDELEKSRRLGLALLTWKRFGQIQGGDLAVLMTFSLFVALIPLTLMIFSWITGFRPTANVASVIIHQYNLKGAEADIVRSTFASANAARSTSTVLGAISWLVAGFPAAVAVQKTFARAWRVPELSLFHSYFRGGVWFLLYLVVYVGVDLSRWAIDRNIALGVLAAPTGVGLLFLLWMATPHLLLGKDLGGWRGLLPTAIAGAAVSVAFRLFSSLFFPHWLSSWAIPFGAIGASLALLTWVGFLMTGWVGVACFGAVYWERIADEEVVLAVETDRA